jgi:hypothetical protein
MGGGGGGGGGYSNMNTPAALAAASMLAAGGVAPGGYGEIIFYPLPLHFYIFCTAALAANIFTNLIDYYCSSLTAPSNYLPPFNPRSLPPPPVRRRPW